MWTLRILKEPIKYQTIGGFLFRLFGVSRRSEQLKCKKEQCTCYGLEDAYNCDKDCENPIW